MKIKGQDISESLSKARQAAKSNGGSVADRKGVINLLFRSFAA
jgi:hypothetical protein